MVNRVPLQLPFDGLPWNRHGWVVYGGLSKGGLFQPPSALRAFTPETAFGRTRACRARVGVLRTVW